MGAAPASLGTLLGNDVHVYRAFALDGHRRKNGTVRARAFYRGLDHADGLSVGRTPEACVAHLATNHGYCRLLVGSVHALPHALSVRTDPEVDGHALIHNIPCIDSASDEERKRAELIAGKLARLAEMITCEPFYPQAEGPHPPPILP